LLNDHLYVKVKILSAFRQGVAIFEAANWYFAEDFWLQLLRALPVQITQSGIGGRLHDFAAQANLYDSISSS
jgi:hypothetical protein